MSHPSGPDTRQPCDLLVAGGTLLTMDDATGRITDGAVAVRDGVVVAVGRAVDLERVWAPAGTIDSRGCVVLPGMIDAHQHLTADRLVRSSIPDTLPAEVAIHQWAVPLHAVLEPVDDEVSATLAAADALRHGVTTIVEAGTCAHPLVVADACERAGVRAHIGTWGSDTPGLPRAGTATDVVRRAAELVDALRDRPLVRPQVALVGHDLMTDELAVAASRLARGAGVGLTFHLSPDRRDGASYAARTGRRPLVHLHGLGVLGPHVLVAHAVHIDDAERDVLVGTGTAVAACPWAYLRLAQGATAHHRYHELGRAGGRLAVGCDSENAGDRIDVLGAAALLVGLLRDREEDPTHWSAHRALRLATVDGAAAIGRPDLGVLAPGRPADLVVASLPALAGDAELDLVWGHGARGVRDVVVAGRVVVRDGVTLGVDEGAATALARDRRHRVTTRAGLEITP